MNMKPFLKYARTSGKAAQFAGGSFVDDDSSATFFLSLHQPSADSEGFQSGDLLAVSSRPDAEPGDLVVWWTGAATSLALARVQEDFSLAAVAGFSTPTLDAEPVPRVRGVVVGRLRQAKETP
ncbi:MAG: hypothetical protein QGH51_09500 [Planctomycetota bacterium]|nr:hypothetical protein [Planctomycetota bacterium]